MKMQNVKAGPTYIVLSPEKLMPPTIIFSRYALKWIECLVEAHNEEIGFFGVVDQLPDYTFYVRDIFYPKHQLISSATCEISPEGETKIMEWLIEKGREDDINKMILWGHSHHTMGVFASHQDETQALQRMNSNKANVLRIIVNKDGLMSVSFLDFSRQVRFDNIVWKAEEKINAEAEYEVKISEINTIIASNIAASLKLAGIYEIIKDDRERKGIVEKIATLKIENAPAKSNVTTYDHSHQYGSYDYSSGGNNKNVATWPPAPNVNNHLPSPVVVRSYNGVPQTPPLTHNTYKGQQGFGDDGWEDAENSAAVQILLNRYRED